MQLLGKRKLRSLVSLDRALTIAESLKGLEAFKGSEEVLRNAEKIASYIEKLNADPESLESRARKVMSQLMNSLGFIKNDKQLTSKGKELLQASPPEQHYLISSALAAWEPLKIVVDYLNEAKEATIDDLDTDLGGIMKRRTEKLVELDLIEWPGATEGFKSLNPHKFNAIVKPLAIGFGFVRKRGDTLLVTTKGTEFFRICE